MALSRWHILNDGEQVEAGGHEWTIGTATCTPTFRMWQAHCHLNVAKLSYLVVKIDKKIVCVVPFHHGDKQWSKEYTILNGWCDFQYILC